MGNNVEKEKLSFVFHALFSSLSRKEIPKAWSNGKKTGLKFERFQVRARLGHHPSTLNFIYIKKSLSRKKKST
jgi:hypothetical protein